MVELMAPAGNKEALRAAIANGADAVYLGGQDFNARQLAENFSRDEIVEAIEYAHERGVRVYVTVNTLIKNTELDDAIDYLYFLGENRADGVIVQDLGLAWAARKALPELKLMASTQMTVTNALGAELLGELGFKRVILARELSLDEIAGIKRKCRLEVEVFVHGALCFCYSGQCLLSSLVGGRSGNRGRCAQPCRLTYTLVDDRGRELEAKAEHLLSTRDLCTLELVPRLIQAGVDAFKIEGRMRRPEYVAVVTRAYRRAIDRYLENPEKFNVDPEEIREVAQVFNRDFTPGYLLGDPGAELMSYGRPSNRGIYIGRVAGKEAGRYLVRLEGPLRRGDGIEVWIREGHAGLMVEDIRVGGKKVEEAPAGTMVSLELPPKARPGDRIFKTSDASLLSWARSTYAFGREGRKIPVHMEVWSSPGQPFKIKVSDEEGHTGEAASTKPAEVAIKHPLTEEVLKEQLDRLGNTPYELKSLKINLQDRPMVPLSIINQVRRGALADLSVKRREAFPRSVPPRQEFRATVASLRREEEKRISRIPSLSVAVGSSEAAWVALEAGAERVYLGGEVWRGRENPSLPELQSLCEEARRQEREFFVAFPRVWQEREDHYIRRELDKWLGAGVRRFLVGNLGSLKLLAEYGLTGWADYTFNVFNDLTLQALKAWGVEGATLSPELNLEEIRKLRPILPLEAIVHGRFPLMISAHCVLGARLGGKAGRVVCSRPCEKTSFGLRDRLGFVFPVTTDTRCRFYLYNSKTLDVISALDLFKGTGVAMVRLELREKESSYIRRITRLYREALLCLKEGEVGALSALAEEVERLVGREVTRGHYFRGVL
ncbi:MAG: U32 family peptidase [Thermanaeromonas sp.]|uniref:DUF3656 domain-containing U32 family peptidase n=1 Tax=Thermanaeromonas sp. TaxID=2003697 RepID=UPI00243C1788|nr:U32 family peptidase [Thermanaeromonas sp.]MCG0277486.1 U32 family peptidase [Thermanaeromonas sp.]